MKKGIKLGLIGVGNWGINYVKTIYLMKNVELVLVTSKKEKLKKYLNSTCKVEKDWRKLILSDDLDGVIISSPPSSHYEIIKECLKIKLPILVEKPFVLNIRNAKEIVNLAKKNSSLIMVDYIHLYHPAFIKLKENLNDYHDIKNIEIISGNHGPFRSDVRALWDWAPHDIALCLELTEKTPELAKAYFLKRDYRYKIPAEIVSIELLFPGGLKTKITIGNLFKNKLKKLTIDLDSFSLIYEPTSSETLKKHFYNNDQISISTNNEKPLENLIFRFVNAIQSKSVEFHDLELSIKVTRLLTEIEKLLN